jgi:hypothetical protein
MRNRIDIDSKHSRATFKRSGRDWARSCQKSREPRRALERKLTGSANWKSSHHQSVHRLSVGTRVAIEPALDSTDGSADMPSVTRRASKILDEYGAAQSDLIGKAVVLTDGKAGTVENVWLDELHGLRISIKGHEGRWPVSTIKFES